MVVALPIETATLDRLPFLSFFKFPSIGFVHLFFACLVLRFPDMKLNPGPKVSVPRNCRYLYANINGLSANINELSVASSRFDIVTCAETLVSARKHAAELIIPGFGRPTLSLRDVRPGTRGMALYIRDGFAASRQAKFECSCCEGLLVWVCGSRQNFYIFGVYRNPSTDDRILDCLLSSMSEIQSVDRKAVFSFRSAACEWSPLTGMEVPWTWSWLICLTFLGFLLEVSWVGLIDHSYISVNLSTSLRVLDFCSSRVVYQNSRV